MFEKQIDKSFVGVQGAVFQKSPLPAGGKMITYKLKQIMWANKVSILLLLVALFIITLSCSQPSTSPLDIHLADHVFHLDLSGKTIKIRDERGTFSKAIKIKKIQGDYIAHIGSVQPGKCRWYIELEGYQPVDLSIDISPGKSTVKKVLLTPRFGSVYAWGVDAAEPGKPMKIPMKVKIRAFERSVLANEGITVTGLTPGDCTIEAQARGFEPLTHSFGVKAGKSMEVKLVFERKPGPGSIKITAKNAINPAILIEKELKIEAAGKNARGKANEGVILYDIAPGEYTVKGNVEGFTPGEIQVKVIEGKIAEADLFLSPQFEENEIARIILTWGDQPRDLDAYLVNMEEAIQINWAQRVMKRGTAVEAELDVDARYGKGPETITIYKGAKGTYKFHVILYIFNGIYLGSSDAKAEIITKHDIKTIRIPTGSDCETRGWDVANLRIDGTNVYIETINKCYAPQLVEVEKDRSQK
jgi:uncharacterized protein YfaP (DUF2135 family)